MEGLSAEVSEKIRAAISAKLKELGAYVDDELPDYIMVLVANRKNQAQMKEDLQLFLHQHADVFTAWLGDILNKLKDVTKKPKPAYTIGNNIKETKISATKKKGEKGEKIKKKKKKPTDGTTKKKKVKSLSKSPPTAYKKPISKSRSRSRSPRPARDQSYEDRNQSYDNRSSSYDNRDRSYDSRDNRDQSYDSRDRSYDSRDRNRRLYSEREGDRQRSRSPRDRSDSNRRSDYRDREQRREKSPASPRKKSIKSSIGAVVSRTSADSGPYDPMQLFKKSAMASQVQVARKPVSISSATSGNRKKRVGSSIQSQKLILKAVADADKSIAKKRKEARQKDAELEAIHKSRSKATMMAKRFKVGHLDGSKSGQDEEEEEQPAEERISPHSNSPPMKKKVLKISPVYEEITIIKKKKKTPKKSKRSLRHSDSESDSKKDDLRLRLDARRKKRKQSLSKAPKVEEPVEEESFEEPIEELYEEPETDPNSVKEEDTADAELERIRQRALNSMIQNQQHRRESTEKKILIPLNEESSEEDDDEDAISLSSNDLIETRKDQPLQDPKFIVTLDGINSSYFKSKDNFGSANINAEQAMDLTANNINVTIPVQDTSPKTVSLVKQTSLKTADVARSQKPAVMINKPTASIAPMPKESTRLSLPKAALPASKPPPKQQQNEVVVDHSKPKIIRKKITAPKTDHEPPPPKKEPIKKEAITTLASKKIDNTIRNKKEAVKKVNVVKTPITKTVNKTVKSPTKTVTKTVKSPTKTVNKAVAALQQNSNPGSQRKKIRAKISGPEPDPPQSRPQPIPVVTTKEVCKFWPQCKRGDSCIYLHPKSPRPVPSVNTPLPPLSKDKFKWTSRSASK